jgi:hypothetical protein
MTDHIRTRPLGADGDVVNVAADSIETRNGAALDEPEMAERIKVTFGDDGDQQDVKDAAGHRLPVADSAVATALATIQTELAQKLEASDLAGLASALNQGTANTTLASILSSVDGLEGFTDGIETALGLLATQTTAAAILTKLSADPATQTTLAALLADDGGPGSSPPALTNGGTGKLGYLRNILDALRGTLTISGAVTVAAAADQATTLTDGRKTVTVPGTAVAIRTSLACKWATVTALTTNTDQVNVGGSGALATFGSTTGTPLLPGGSITIPVDNANKVFVDARVAGEGVSFTVAS